MYLNFYFQTPVAKPSGPTSPCTLDAPTQSLMKLIFDNDMFRDAMKNFDIGMFNLLHSYWSLTLYFHKPLSTSQDSCKAKPEFMQANYPIM
jgi:hypothetical protein